MNIFLLCVAIYSAVALICACILFEIGEDTDYWHDAVLWPFVAANGLAYLCYVTWLQLRSRWLRKN